METSIQYRSHSENVKTFRNKGPIAIVRRDIHDSEAGSATVFSFECAMSILSNMTDEDVSDLVLLLTRAQKENQDEGN